MQWLLDDIKGTVSLVIQRIWLWNLHCSQLAKLSTKDSRKVSVRMHTHLKFALGNRRVAGSGGVAIVANTWQFCRHFCVLYTTDCRTSHDDRHHHHYAAIVFRGWAKASACCFHIYLSCAILCQMVLFQSSLSLQRLAGIPLGLFLS